MARHPTAQLTDERVQEALCLAGLSYRGFHDAAVGRFHSDLIERRIVDGLEGLEPLKGKWDLAWGPAVYRAPLSLLDDGLVYVVRSRRPPDRYVVAIRGTNPISRFDWLFGDFWTAYPAPWPYDAAASVSLSSALGLAIIKRLRAKGPRTDALAELWRIADHRTAELEHAARGVWDQVGALAQDAIAPFRRMLAAWLETLAKDRTALHTAIAQTPLGALEGMLKAGTLELLIGALKGGAALAGGRLDLIVLGLLEDEAHLQATLGGGNDLLGFLAAAVDPEKDGPVEITVTGHSKGGGLASTVALWLIETQGKDAPEAERWDPKARAKIDCYSFAGPTAGDAAFAARSNRLIGGRCHRIANTFDIVPHAWEAKMLGKIATLYDPHVAAIPGLAGLVKTLSGLTEGVGYSQVDKLTELKGAVDEDLPFFDQFVYQHMQAYLEMTGLTTMGINQNTFFDPL